MGGQLDTLAVDRAIASLAASQHGVVHRAQLKDAGLGGDAVDHRIRAGRLHRIHRGVYAVGHPLLTVEGRLVAATLACGADAAVSHVTAADLWEIRPSASARIEVTIPTRSARRRPGVVVHRCRTSPAEVTRHRGIPLTTVARTLVDIAEVLAPRPLERAIHRAEALRRFDLREVETVLTLNPHRVGSARLRSALSKLNPLVLTRNDLEERFHDLCRDAGTPLPAVNVHVEGCEVDFLWRDERLIAETDGHAHHGTREAFERDRARNARLLTAGYRVVRFTHRQVAREPAHVARVLRSLLGGTGQAAAGSSKRRRIS